MFIRNWLNVYFDRVVTATRSNDVFVKSPPTFDLLKVTNGNYTFHVIATLSVAKFSGKVGRNSVRYEMCIKIYVFLNLSEP